MSFEKAQDLIMLAMMASERHGGVTLADIEEQFGVSHRTAQRMTEALSTVFFNVESTQGDDRRRRWKMRVPVPPHLAIREEDGLEALDVAIKEAREDDRHRQARSLTRLKEMFLNQLPPHAARRAETDAEAVLASLERVRRPGPHGRILPEVADAIYDAFKGPYRMTIRYEKRTGDISERIIEPLGVLLGPRSYLVARLAVQPYSLRHFRMDRVRWAECLDETFEMDPVFSLVDHAAQSFASYHDPEQFGEIVWRFTPEAADNARDFQFHPNQQLEPQPDGSLIVRFEASGWLEMSWFLYQWGDAVEVISPKGLREMVHPWRRTDFGALP